MNSTSELPKLFLLFIAFCLVSACAKKYSVERTIDYTRNDSIPEITKKIYVPDFIALIAHSKISYTQNNKTSRLNAIIALEKSDFLFIDAFHFFGALLYRMKIDGENVRAFYPKDNLLYTGKSTHENLYLLFSINLSLVDFYLLLANPLRMLGAHDTKLIFLDDGVLLHDHSTKIFAGKNLLITKIILQKFEKDSITILYNNYTYFSHTYFPQEIHIQDHVHLTEATLRFTDITFANEIDKKRFDIRVPEGVTIQLLQ